MEQHSLPVTSDLLPLLTATQEYQEGSQELCNVVNPILLEMASSQRPPEPIVSMPARTTIPTETFDPLDPHQAIIPSSQEAILAFKTFWQVPEQRREDKQRAPLEYFDSFSRMQMPPDYKTW